jgi:hypothetical protein
MPGDVALLERLHRHRVVLRHQGDLAATLEVGLVALLLEVGAGGHVLRVAEARGATFWPTRSSSELMPSLTTRAAPPDAAPEMSAPPRRRTR